MVELDKYGLALRCTVCKKTLAYPIGSALSLTKWDEKKKEFIERHNKSCRRES